MAIPSGLVQKRRRYEALLGEDGLQRAGVRRISTFASVVSDEPQPATYPVISMLGMFLYDGAICRSTRLLYRKTHRSG